jgi:hypothetical protein
VREDGLHERQWLRYIAVTLSPVFRSAAAVRALGDAGVWRQLEPAARGQLEANANVKRDLPAVLEPAYFDGEGPSTSSGAAVGIEFVQEFFFLILFRSVLQTLGLPAADLRFCSELNFCIQGTITASDNLFDDQDKALLPLRAGMGARFRSILQLLAFERLMSRALDRAVDAGSMPAASAGRLQKELLSRMAAIGTLEGSEEAGVAHVLEPGPMIETVHRLRGGALFELAFIAPRLLERAVESSRLARAEAAIAKLGTAFQIVDDLTDFEFDLTHGRHNLLISQIAHRGSAEEQSRLQAMRHGRAGDGDPVVEMFSDSGRAVVALGEHEARIALQELHALGFWFPPELSHELVTAIVGSEGVERMRTLG